MTSAHQAEAAVAPLASLSRRRLLKGILWGSAGGLAVLAGGAAWLRRSPVDDLPLPAGIQHLSQAEYYLFASAIPALLPTAGSSLLTPEQVPVLQHIDATMGLLDPAIRKELGVGLGLFDHAALLGHGRRFVDLDVQQQVRYFDDWSVGNTLQRTLATVVKQLVYVGYWRDPLTWPAIGFDGPVTERWGIASLGNTPLPQETEHAASAAEEVLS